MRNWRERGIRAPLGKNKQRKEKVPQMKELLTSCKGNNGFTSIDN